MKKIIAGFLVVFVLTCVAHPASAQVYTTTSATSTIYTSTSTDALSLQTRQVILAGQLVFTIAAQAKNFSDSSLDQAVHALVLEWIGIAQNQLTHLQVALNNARSGQ